MSYTDVQSLNSYAWKSDYIIDPRNSTAGLRLQPSELKQAITDSFQNK